jgi:hypothetical protein
MMNAEINQKFAEKVARGIFRPVIRHVTGNDPEERLAEAVALTFELYAKKARAGVELDDALLVHHARLRAVDLGRQLVRSGQRKRDALDTRNYHQGRVEILRIDGLPDEDGTFRREEDGEVVIGLADGLAQDPTPKIIGALDLASWADTLGPDDRAVLVARYEGHTLKETAEAMGSTISPVFARLKRLGTELARRAEIEIQPRPARRRAPFAAMPTVCSA